MKLKQTNTTEKELPEALKTELKVGKWYKDTTKGYENIMGFVISIDDEYKNEFQGYGFASNGNWIVSKKGWNFGSCNWREATQQEVSSALIAEAKKRGFVEGAKFKSSFSENDKIRTVTETDSWYFNINENTLTISTNVIEWNKAQSNPIIFENGKWAEIIQ